MLTTEERLARAEKAAGLKTPTRTLELRYGGHLFVSPNFGGEIELRLYDVGQDPPVPEDRGTVWGISPEDAPKIARFLRKKFPEQFRKAKTSK